MGLINAPFFIMAKTKKESIKAWTTDITSARKVYSTMKCRSGVINCALFFNDELLEASGFSRDERPANY